MPADLNTTFPHFTALPRPNDYRADCFADSPPCVATADQTRGVVDTAGNLLLPVNWGGILVRQSGIPVPRLLRATVRTPVAFAQPPTIATKWQFKTKVFGVQKVQLATGPAPGQHRISIKTKRWFAAAEANDTAANTRLTVTIGTQCFTRAATVKVD